jgi:hypothetical protein
MLNFKTNINDNTPKTSAHVHASAHTHTHTHTGAHTHTQARTHRHTPDKIFTLLKFIQMLQPQICIT